MKGEEVEIVGAVDVCLDVAAPPPVAGVFVAGLGAGLGMPTGLALVPLLRRDFLGGAEETAMAGPDAEVEANMGGKG